MQEQTRNEAAESAAALSREAFSFVQTLATEVSRGVIELPSLPDVSIRVREALSDEDITSQKLAKIISADPGLVSRILALANSAAFSPGGGKIEQLDQAISRIGQENVRNTSLAYAVQQLKNSDAHKHIVAELSEVWQRACLTAALAYVIARRSRAAGPDIALVAGLLHNVGKIYMFSRSDRESALLTVDPKLRDSLMDDWHPGVGRAIADNWGLPPAVGSAIGNQNEWDRDFAAPPNLTNVLIAAVLMAGVYGQTDENGEPIAPAEIPPVRRLGITPADWQQIMSEADDEINSLKEALGT